MANFNGEQCSIVHNGKVYLIFTKGANYKANNEEPYNKTQEAIYVTSVLLLSQNRLR